MKKEVYQSSALQRRHDPVSLPVSAKPWADLTKFTVFSIPIILILSVKGIIKPGMVGAERFPAVLSTNLPVAFGWGATLPLMLLPQVMAFVLIGWWNNLDTFYSARQPWAGLMVPALVQKSLTFNYMDCRWRLWKALANRHYHIALLSIGSGLSFLLPVPTANILRLKAGSRQNDVLKGI
ncbi:hypothetical protein AYL99_09422 [Fonsecaea erecta]|uniref:Uncharacterized protein n=1 Tax=Fonsecaea erecta TaxID=1367422 RepID=A0A178ZAL9_9EURO|nr:hypothetical protein AYL99_09422 [Fonsecaea erecta]OAP56243.1 hypothetical protein AYL99_09422 [Fonsecaea erecta]